MTGTSPDARASSVPGDRRPITAWGAFLGSQAAIGGNLFVALGLVLVSAQGAGALAFALSGLVFLLVGLSYVELASTFPVAGGGYYFVMRGLGDLAGFVAGAALILDLTIGIALFSAMGASYANTFAPALLGAEASLLSGDIPTLGRFEWFWFAESLALATLLIVINVRGMRERTGLTTAVGAVALVGLTAVVAAGFLRSWDPAALLAALEQQRPTGRSFVYGVSLSIISFVGLQAFALTAAECLRPGRVLPRPAIALILTTLLFAVSLPCLALGALAPSAFGDGQSPLAVLAERIAPSNGVFPGVIAALGCAVLLVSANSFVASLSRLFFSMGQYDGLGEWSRRVHAKTLTPLVGLAAFGLLIAIELAVAFLWPDAMPLDVLANMYAFGAALAYSLVVLSMIRLRFSDPHLPRPYRMPLNLPISAGGRRVHFPLLAVIGLLGAVALLVMVLATHEIGRIAGPGWIIICLCYYFVHRRRRRLSVLGSVPRDWVGEQMRVLASAGEKDLADSYSRAISPGGSGART